MVLLVGRTPYGKSWKKDLETMGGKEGMRDPRFKVMHNGEELSLVTRSSDFEIRRLKWATTSGRVGSSLS